MAAHGIHQPRDSTDVAGRATSRPPSIAQQIIEGLRHHRIYEARDGRGRRGGGRPVVAEEGLHLPLGGTGVDEHGVEAVVVLLGEGVHREGNTGWSSDGAQNGLEKKNTGGKSGRIK